MNILEELAGHARERIREKEREHPLEELRERAKVMPRGDFSLERALRRNGSAEATIRSCGLHTPGVACESVEDAARGALECAEGIRFLCECKRASPSKGLIAEDFPYLQIAREYEEAGAAAISVLTEPKWFLGSDEYLRQIAAQARIPVLRKDFTVSEYMIYEAKLLGASAILLICAILTQEELVRFHGVAEDLGLSCLVEAHDEEEVRRARAAGARIVGVNNRNLKDFTVDVNNSLRLRSLVPPEEAVFVAESGIRTREDVKRLVQGGIDAVLIGETLMRAPDKGAMLRELAG